MLDFNHHIILYSYTHRPYGYCYLVRIPSSPFSYELNWIEFWHWYFLLCIVIIDPLLLLTSSIHPSILIIHLLSIQKLITIDTLVNVHCYSNQIKVKKKLKHTIFDCVIWSILILCKCFYYLVVALENQIIYSGSLNIDWNDTIDRKIECLS